MLTERTEGICMCANWVACGDHCLVLRHKLLTPSKVVCWYLPYLRGDGKAETRETGHSARGDGSRSIALSLIWTVSWSTRTFTIIDFDL